MNDETVKAIEDKDDPASIKYRKDGYNAVVVIACCFCIYFGENFFSATINEKNELLKVRAIIEKAPELHIKSSGKSRRHYVTFKIRGSDEVEIDRQAAFNMQEFVDEVKIGDTVVIRTPFHFVTEENNDIRLLSTFEVIGISKNSKEYIDYEVYTKREETKSLAWLSSAVWAVFCSLYFREVDETPKIFGKKLKFFDTLIVGILIIYLSISFW